MTWVLLAVGIPAYLLIGIVSGKYLWRLIADRYVEFDRHDSETIFVLGATSLIWPAFLLTGIAFAIVGAIGRLASSMGRGKQ
jgi:hypothetical protein